MGCFSSISHQSELIRCSCWLLISISYLHTFKVNPCKSGSWVLFCPSTALQWHIMQSQIYISATVECMSSRFNSLPEVIEPECKVCAVKPTGWYERIWSSFQNKTPFRNSYSIGGTKWSVAWYCSTAWWLGTSGFNGIGIALTVYLFIVFITVTMKSSSTCVKQEDFLFLSAQTMQLIYYLFVLAPPWSHCSN